MDWIKDGLDTGWIGYRMDQIRMDWIRARHRLDFDKTRKCSVCIKCLFFDDEMCTLKKVGGEDSKGRRVL